MITTWAGHKLSRGTGTPPVPTELTIQGIPLDGEVGEAYSFIPTVEGGTPGYTYSVTSGSLPTGLTLNTSTGEISGTPA